mgnify:CR=1 FL=1
MPNVLLSLRGTTKAVFIHDHFDHFITVKAGKLKPLNFDQAIYDLINLLDGYPIIQLVDADGNTLLHKAVYKNNYPAAKFLIMKGIDLSTKNNQGVTALEIAVAQDRPEIETLLRSAGGK